MAVQSVKRPLLVIDGNSFAHRAYHALPKTIRRHGNTGRWRDRRLRQFLLRFFETERPRAVLVAWDTLDEPTYRHEALEAYQSGREFDDELVDQLEVLPDFVAACGFACAKAAGYEADDFLGSCDRQGGAAWRDVLVATGDRDAFQLASERTTILQPIRGGGLARIGPARGTRAVGIEPGQVPDFIALRGDPSDRIPGAKGIGPKSAAAFSENTGRSKQCSLQAGSSYRPMNYGSTERSRPWTDPRPCLLSGTKSRAGPRHLPSPVSGN